MLSRSSFLRAATQITKRNFSRNASEELKAILAQQIPEKQKEIKEIKEKFGEHVLTQATVNMAYGGMRGIKCLITETSLLDAEEGIRYRNLTLKEIQEKLPKAEGGSEPLPEAVFWLLLTGEIPTADQVKAVTAEWHARSKVPENVVNTIKSFDKSLHPMTQFSSAILLLQQQSQFARAYSQGVHKSKYWETHLEDTMTLLAQLPVVAAQIYRQSFHDGSLIAPDTSLDWGANYTHMLGFNNKAFYDCMRLYLSIHADHEGGNVSAHATHLVGSALSDPYLSLSAGMNGLAGPLHGLANQEVLAFLNDIIKRLDGKEATKENLTALVWDILKSGRVVPGYGHAVLRKTDPRFTLQREFALKNLPDDKMFQLVSTLYEIVPGILTEQGKTKNPFPNVDAHSGVLLQHYGLVQQDYYTVLFGVSRAMGVLASLIWDRAYGFPIERPKSLTTEWIKKEMAKHQK